MVIGSAGQVQPARAEEDTTHASKLAMSQLHCHHDKTNFRKYLLLIFYLFIEMVHNYTGLQKDIVSYLWTEIV